MNSGHLKHFAQFAFMFKAVQKIVKKNGKLRGFKMKEMWAALSQGPADETTCNMAWSRRPAPAPAPDPFMMAAWRELG